MSDLEPFRAIADDLAPGDIYRWAGELALVDHVDEASSSCRRRGLHVHADINGTRYRLHYWANEWVEIVERQR